MTSEPPVPPQTPTAVIEKEENLPCGCHIVYFSNGSGRKTPCAPHAIGDAGRMLLDSAQQMASAGQLLQIAAARALDAQAARPRLLAPDGRPV